MMDSVKNFLGQSLLKIDGMTFTVGTLIVVVVLAYLIFKK
jgi:hypothetical protein